MMRFLKIHQQIIQMDADFFIYENRRHLRINSAQTKQPERIASLRLPFSEAVASGQF